MYNLCEIEFSAMMYVRMCVCVQLMAVIVLFSSVG